MKIAKCPALLLLLQLTAAAAQASDVPAAGEFWPKMQSIVPRGYVCCRASAPLKIDGRADEPAWADAPWTQDFVDIEGARKPAPRFRTRAKLLWDDTYLYVYAELQEPHVWATIHKKNDVIFYDNDFEVFINPDASNHNYYEFEMNALNTIWELTLDKPYKDGGPAHLGTNLEGLRSAVHIDGTLNDASDTDRGWSVEIAFPWAGLARYAKSAPCPPTDGQQWRLGFSRVEWLVDIIDGKYRKVSREAHPEDNWVWSPTGVIDMHRPERWGYIQFSTQPPGAAAFRPDPTLPVRDLLMEIYYRQREFQKQNNRYTGSPAELGVAAALLTVAGGPVTIEMTKAGFVASAPVKLPGGATHTLHVREDSKLSEQ